MSSVSVRSKSVVLLLFTHCLLLLQLFVEILCLVLVFYAVLCVISGFEITPLVGRELALKLKNFFPCSTQLSMKFILLINVKNILTLLDR